MKHFLKYYFISIPTVYFLTSYFSNFYSGIFNFVILTLFFQLTCVIAIPFFLKNAFEKILISWHNNRTFLFLLIVVGALPFFAIAISWQYPSLFDHGIFFMESNLLPLFAGLAVISTTGAIILKKFMQRKGFTHFIRPFKFIHLIQLNLPGVFIASSFFLTYFIFAQTINFPNHHTLDQFFDTDVSQWISRLTLHPTDDMPPIRGVHPAVMLILRPLVWLISIFINWNQLQAVYVLSALAGAACVFLVWLIVKRRTNNTTFSLIFASILGAGTSHLLLSSMLETYIFSALALIIFCYLMQREKTSLKSTIPTGIIIFGITITNLAQACILYFLKVPRLKVMVQFILAVVATTLFLNSFQIQLFPKARPLYTPSSLVFEQRYQYDLFESPWRLKGRVNLISRAILLYGIVAPNPYLVTEEIGATVPNFRTYQIGIKTFSVAGYKGLADITAKFWLAIIGMAFILFTRELFVSPRQGIFAASLVLCLGFNFVLHSLYGDDPVLYSPNWVYALVLFVSSSLGKWAHKKWLHIGLIIFLGMIIYTNLGLVHQIMEVSLPYYGK